MDGNLIGTAIGVTALATAGVIAMNAMTQSSKSINKKYRASTTGRKLKNTSKAINKNFRKMVY